MTDTEQKALALVNEVRAERSCGVFALVVAKTRYDCCFEALCSAIDAHEADKKAFSDAMKVVQQFITGPGWDRGDHYQSITLSDGRKVRFADFILPDPEPDPLVEAVTVTIRGKGDHRVRLDELARLIRGGARIERIEQ